MMTTKTKKTSTTAPTFTLPPLPTTTAGASPAEPSPIPVRLPPTADAPTAAELLAFPAFDLWHRTLRASLARQHALAAHPFHHRPYALRGVEIQAVDWFGHGKSGGNGDGNGNGPPRRGRLGFVKLQADVSTEAGERLPGSVFLRGGSVAVLVSVRLLLLLLLQKKDCKCSKMLQQCVAQDNGC